MMTLQELYENHQNGKVSDKWNLYLIEYDRLFKPYRERPISFLEIGVQNGGSLEIWSQYFAAGSSFVGCDINPDCGQLTYENPNISVVIGDANTDVCQQTVLEISDSFDLLIDDGSHTSADIIRSFCRYFNHVKMGGLFVVEDMHCSYWQEFDGGLYDPLSSMSFFKVLTDIINHEHWGIKKDASAVLAPFQEKYNINIDESVLSTVHSVEFINSMCIIKKFPIEYNTLGKRFIAGDNECVVAGHLNIDVKQQNAPDQLSNPWTAREFHPLKEIALQRTLLMERGRELLKITANDVHQKRQIDELRKEIISLHQSKSWRLTVPLRKLTQITRTLGNSIASLMPSRHRTSGALARRALNFLRGRVPIKRSVDKGLGDQLGDYKKWIELYSTVDAQERERITRDIDKLHVRPLISIVMPTYNSNKAWLTQAIESVRAQLYSHWELCIADDASTDSEIRPLLQRFAKTDPRIKIVFRTENGHISAASNSAIELASGDWIALLDHDDVLHETALYYVASTVQDRPDADMIYTDEDKLDNLGQRSQPFCKPDWSPHLAASQAYLGHLVCFKTSSLRVHLKFDESLNGAQDYDLWLRCAANGATIVHIPKILYHWRTHRQSTASNADSKPYAHEAGRKAVARYVGTKYPHTNAETVSGVNLFTYKIQFAFSPATKISIIIPTKDRIDLLSSCVEGILYRTDWRNLEIIILNNRSSEEATYNYFKEITELDQRVKVIDANIPFNWSELNNIGAQQATGDILIFLNNDTDVISAQWLHSLAGYASLPDVGIVGALLKFEDDTIQHTGVVVGMGGWADHIYKGQKTLHSGGGPFISPMITRNVLAVTGACMAISKEKFELLGGFDESFIICGSDVELCLRAHKRGFYNIICSEALLYHYESKTRTAYIPPEDFEQSRLRYAPYRTEKTDPYFNRNLSLQATKPELSFGPRDA